MSGEAHEIAKRAHELLPKYLSKCNESLQTQETGSIFGVPSTREFQQEF